jgi:hypothetical protein
VLIVPSPVDIQTMARNVRENATVLKNTVPTIRDAWINQVSRGGLIERYFLIIRYSLM